jgi:hypothetical protein
VSDKAESHGFKQMYADATHALSEFLTNQGMPTSGSGGSASNGGGDANAGASKSTAPFNFAEEVKKAIYPT